MESRYDQGLEAENERLKNGTAVLRGDGFLIGFLVDYMQAEEMPAVHRKLCTPQIRLNLSDISSRVVNHWESKGIIPDERSESGGWREFSPLGFAWLEIVKRLRKFGLPIAALQKARSSFEELPKASSEEGFTVSIFEFYVFLAIQGTPVNVLVFADGSIDFATNSEYSDTPLFAPFADHIRLSLNSVVSWLYPQSIERLDYRTGIELSSSELQVIKSLRFGNYKSITVHMQNGDAKVIEGKSVANTTSVSDLLRESDFLNLEVKKRDGNVVSITKTDIKKLSS